LTVGLGVLLIYGRWAERPTPIGSLAVVEAKALALPVPVRPPAAANPATANPGTESRPENRTPLIAQLARIEARRRLALAGSSVYLDSLLVGPDSMIRRWGEGTVLRVLIGKPPTADPVVPGVGQALRMWESLRLGPTFVETQDSAEANIFVGWVTSSGSERTGEAEVQSNAVGEIELVRISLARTDQKGLVLGLEETRSVALHEFGHALGLPHSGRPSDVMFPTVSVLRLSERDRSSAQLLYGIPPGALREPIPP
jgi:hypothetical protein